MNDPALSTRYVEGRLVSAHWWHERAEPNHSGWEWALNDDGTIAPFGTRLGIQPPDGTGNGCPCARCRREKPNEWVDL